MLTSREAKIRKIRLLREKNKRNAESSLASFARQAWPIVEPARSYHHNWHIDVICDHLMAVTDREIRNLIINIPPRHMKSLLVSVFWPAWVWGPYEMPSECWLFGSYSPKLATRDSVKARRIIEDPWYVKQWGAGFFRNGAPDPIVSVLRSDQNEKMRYENMASGTRISTTPGGTGTGDGGDIIVVDDPHKVKGVESSVQREAVIEWWDDEMSSRAMEPKRVCKLVIMQRVHDADLCGHLLEDKSEESWEHLCLPFEYEAKTMVDMRGTSLKFEDPRTEEGELLWKDRYDDKAKDDLKGSMTEYQKSGQLQQRPTPREGITFKRKYFEKRWTTDTLPQDISHVLDTWDMTFADDEKGKKTGKLTQGKAFNVGYKLGLAKPNIYVLWEVRKQMGIIGQLKEVPRLRKMDGRTKETLIEKAANGQASADLLKRKIPGVILVTPKGSKEDRAEAQEWIFEGGNVIFPADDMFPWVKEAIEEIVSFGPKAKYKDRVDALVHGLERLGKKLRRTSFNIGDHQKLSQWAIR